MGIDALWGAVDSGNAGGFSNRRGVDRLPVRLRVGLPVLRPATPPPRSDGAGVFALALVVFWLKGARRRGANSIILVSAKIPLKIPNP